jgi:hypothetical protein
MAWSEAKRRYFEAAELEIEIRRQYGDEGLPPDVSYEEFKAAYESDGRPSSEAIERARTNLRFRAIQKRLERGER